MDSPAQAGYSDKNAQETTAHAIQAMKHKSSSSHEYHPPWGHTDNNLRIPCDVLPLTAVPCPDTASQGTKPSTLRSLGNFNIQPIVQAISSCLGSFKHQCFLSFRHFLMDTVIYCSMPSWLSTHVTVFSCWLEGSGTFQKVFSLMWSFLSMWSFLPVGQALLVFTMVAVLKRPSSLSLSFVSPMSTGQCKSSSLQGSTRGTTGGNDGIQRLRCELPYSQVGLLFSQCSQPCSYMGLCRAPLPPPGSLSTAFMFSMQAHSKRPLKGKKSHQGCNH